jgi:hypothetical protein
VPIGRIAAEVDISALAIERRATLLALVGVNAVLTLLFALLGWLLVRTNPKLPLLVTAGLLMLGVLWVLFAPGYWFLLAFGINGAGELFGVYYVNYPAQCSPRSQVRRNISFLMLISNHTHGTPPTCRRPAG